MMAAAEPTGTAGDDHLPPDIWREVLAGLPMKWILRCRSVCKSWYSLISCPSFISYYSSKTLNNNRNRVLLQLVNTISYTLWFSSVDESFREHDDFTWLHGQGFEIVSSCNGLICLYKKPKHSFPGITFLVWNPTTREVVELPSRNRSEYASYIGFGFDSKTSDYKVLCVIDDVCEIFDLSKGVWRSIGSLMPQWRVGPSIVGPIRPDCCLDGVVHWSRKKHLDHNDMILLSFDMSDECFRGVKIPDFTGSQSLTTPRIGGLVYVYVRNTAVSCSVWVMKKYGVTESWTKVSNMDLHDSHDSTCMSLLRGER